MIKKEDIFGYTPDKKYDKPVAYFSMEYAIDQALKIYAGGLGFLAGSHLRSAFELKQNLLGIGILWKYGYYDQGRISNGMMKPDFVEKNYSFLQDTGITFLVTVDGAPVHVKAWLLRPETFGSAPLFLLSTDVPENDEESRSITRHLYDPNETTRIAQSIVLGIGGGKLLDILKIEPATYHMNEGHGLPLNFYLYSKYRNLDEVKKRAVFTTHTPEMAGNEVRSFDLLHLMGFFYDIAAQDVKSLLALNSDSFNYTLAALKFARKANGVSKIHGKVARQMWSNNPGVCEIISITNAQNKSYWKDPQLDDAINRNDDQGIIRRKKEMKRLLFNTVADQCGKLFNEDIITIVWARRFAGYKRADLLLYDWDRFLNFIKNTLQPVQIIWAGKPYPSDYGAIELFNLIMSRVKPFANCAVLTGYEVGLSAQLKKGADVWLNNPRMYHEASGTSGMTAAMNGAINVSLPDGWIPEFAIDKENSFLVKPAAEQLSINEIDIAENRNLMDVLENTVLPAYYNNQAQWLQVLKKAAADIIPGFDANRLAAEYYEKMYSI